MNQLASPSYAKLDDTTDDIPFYNHLRYDDMNIFAKNI